MKNKLLTIFLLSFIISCSSDDEPGIEQVTLFLQNACSTEEGVKVYEIVESSGSPSAEVVFAGEFTTNSPEDLSCKGSEGVTINLREGESGEFETVQLVYLTSNMKYYEESFDPNQLNCIKTTDCFDFQFTAAQRTGSASDFIKIDKPDIENFDIELEISETTLNCFGIGVGTFDGQLIDLAFFEISETSDFIYHLNDTDLKKFKDYFRNNTSPLFYITLYDIYKSSITTPSFTAILKLKTSDQESCLNSNSCLLFKKEEIGNGHPLQASRLYYWENI